MSGLYTELYGPGRPSAPAGPPPDPRDLYASPDPYGTPDPYGAPDPYPAPEAYPPQAGPPRRRAPVYASEPEEIYEEPPPAAMEAPRRGGGGRRAARQEESWEYGSRRNSRPGMSRWMNGTTAAIAGGLALVIAVAGILLYSRGNSPAAAQGKAPDRQIPAPPPSGEAIPPEDAKPPKRKLRTSPVLGSIRDRVGGLTYARLGGAWSLARNDWMRDHGWPTGQDAVAMRNFEGNDDYLSGCYSGQLSRAILYNGPASLKSATERLAAAVEKTDDVYPQQHQRRNIESRAFTVGDRQGWLVRFELRFPQARKENWAFARESVAFVLVDRGRERRPGFLFMTVPSSHKAPGDINLVLNSIRPV